LPEPAVRPHGIVRAAWQPPRLTAAIVNRIFLLPVLVGMSAIHSAVPDATRGSLPRDADAAVRRLYWLHTKALHGYVQRFCPDRVSADDIVQEIFTRAWRHLPRLSADDRPLRPCLFRVARNLPTDADRAARSRPIAVPDQPAEDVRDDIPLDQVLDRQLVPGILQHLSPAHQTVPVETIYRGGTPATAARQLAIPAGTARSRLRYAPHALRQQLQDQHAGAF
jgi:RNA polymerase sigma-70 factor, ECF subfamily